MKKASHRYPPREAFATRPPAEMTAEGGEVGAVTALDRPRFVDSLDVPPTLEGAAGEAAPFVTSDAPARATEVTASEQAAPARRFPWLVLVSVAVATTIGGALFGFWLASAVT